MHLLVHLHQFSTNCLFFSRTVGHKLTLSELQTTEGWISMRYWSRLEKEHLVLHCCWGTRWRRSEPGLLFFSYMGWLALFFVYGLSCFCSVFYRAKSILQDKRAELAGLLIRRLDSST